MKKIILVLSLLNFAQAQIGINNNIPKATLDISASPRNLSSKDGIILPRLSKIDLAKKQVGVYGNNQIGTIIYVSSSMDLSGVYPSSNQVSLINTPGYYYFSSDLKWKPLLESPFDKNLEENIYNVDGSLIIAQGLSGRTVDQNNYSLLFKSKMPKAFSIGNLANNSYSLTVDTQNNRVVIGNPPNNISNQAALEVYANSPYKAFTLQDGSEGNGKILTSADSDGNAYWGTSPFTPIKTGSTFVNTGRTNLEVGALVRNYQGVRSGFILELTKGKWLVNFSLMVTSNFAANSNNNALLTFCFSDSEGNVPTNNSFEYLVGSSYSGWLGPFLQHPENPSPSYSLIQGTIPINVIDNHTTIYFYLKNIEKTDGFSTSQTIQIRQNGENYFYAIPLS